jgi:hypothetical protein
MNDISLFNNLKKHKTRLLYQHTNFGKNYLFIKFIKLHILLSRFFPAFQQNTDVVWCMALICKGTVLDKKLNKL